MVLADPLRHGMGFLSKLFGGDGGSSTGKPDAGQPAPPAAKQESADASPSVAIDQDEATLELSEATPPPPPEPPRSKRTEPALKAAGVAARAKASADSDLSPPSPPVARPAADRAKRSPLEDSVVTSAPKLGPDAVGARGAPAPRPFANKPPKSAPNPGAPPPAPVPGPAVAAVTAVVAPKSDAHATGGFKTRRDHNRSPGFYSSVSPANGSVAVTASSPSSAHLKKATVMGLAPPPPEITAPEPAPSVEIKPALDAKSVVVERQPILSETAGLTWDSAPPTSVAVVREEKEDTSPGLGITRSRHDPRAAVALPSVELDLLLEFVLDIAMGSASDAWLPPIRAAVTRLEEAAGKAERLILHKALRQFTTAIEGSGSLDAERRARVLELFAAVDVALPRPIDVAAQKLLRERLICEQLLSDLASTQPLVVQRLKDEGFTTLERVSRSSALELSEKVSATREQAEQILAIFHGYMLERSQRSADVLTLGKERALKVRLVALSASSDEFQRACDEDDSSARRNARRQRQSDVVQLNLLLAESGEAAILAELERCSVQGKIERMTRWLSERANG